MNTTESNKLIAEFMGNKPFGKDNFNCDMYSNPMNDISYDRYRKDVLTAPEFEYHTSWDWLMPVVRKIVEISCNEDEDAFLSDEYTSILETLPLAIIEDAYKVVVEFIKWYNENK